MKKMFIYLAVFMCVANFAFAGIIQDELLQEDGILFLNEGTSVSLKPGWQGLNVNKNNEIDYHVNCLFIEGQFKHQTLDNLYANILTSYAYGNCRKSKFKAKHYNWHLEGAFGWTFPIFDYGMISPFLAVGWYHLKEKRTRYNPEPKPYGDNIYDIRFYGVRAMLGGDFQYLFSNRLSVGLIACVGLFVCPQVSFQDGTIKEGVSKISNPKEKYTAKTEPFIKIVVPFGYHYDHLKFGFELNYEYIPIKLKSSAKKLTKQQTNGIYNIFGATLTASYVF